MAGVAAVLAHYPAAVVHRVVDPVHGLPGRTKWLPTIAEVREACEQEMAPIRRKMERDRRTAETARLLAGPQAPKPTLAELKERYGENWGIGASAKAERERPPTEEEIKARYEGMTIEASEGLKQIIAARVG